MRPNVSAAPTLRAFAAFCVLSLWCSTSAAEPVVFEMDLPRPDAVEQSASYIVQAVDVDAAAKAVESVGGTVTSVAGMSQAVRATLLPPQVELLRRRSDVRSVLEVTKVTTSSNATHPPRTGSTSDTLIIPR